MIKKETLRRKKFREQHKLFFLNDGATKIAPHINQGSRWRTQKKEKTMKRLAVAMVVALVAVAGCKETSEEKLLRDYRESKAKLVEIGEHVDQLKKLVTAPYVCSAKVVDSESMTDYEAEEQREIACLQEFETKKSELKKAEEELEDWANFTCLVESELRATGSILGSSALCN